ncbi:hypothetical protein GCM10010974_34230 [Brevibacterium sediminis]|uniref:Uncharacterized protein n=1 Tax=Brevibacterium sediminis TaxID=1857024 RepID=A0ABQ1MZ52_9MICO|nr:hypothetical protein GCM10010974_34230 [Brevibacterium sediminis]
MRLSISGALGHSGGFVAERAELRRQLRQIHGVESGLDELFGDLREDIADEEDESRADDIGQESEDSIEQTLQRSQHLIELEQLEHGDESEQPDAETGDLPDRLSDLLTIASIALKCGNLGDEFADRPFDDGGENPGDNENDDCQSDFRQDRPDIQISHVAYLLRTQRIGKFHFLLLILSLFSANTENKGPATDSRHLKPQLSMILDRLHMHMSIAQQNLHKLITIAYRVRIPAADCR